MSNKEVILRGLGVIALLCLILAGVFGIIKSAEWMNKPKEQYEVYTYREVGDMFYVVYYTGDALCKDQKQIYNRYVKITFKDEKSPNKKGYEGILTKTNWNDWELNIIIYADEE